MAKTIWKFPIKITDNDQYLALPPKRRVLSVGLDPEGIPCIWAEVEPEELKPTVPVQIFVIGTGEEAPNALFLGTFVQGKRVWHTYYK